MSSFNQPPLNHRTINSHLVNSRSFPGLALRAVLLSMGIFTQANVLPAEDNFKRDMQQVYSAYEQLQLYVVQEARFKDPTEEVRINGLLEKLESGFSNALEHKKEVTTGPAFADTLKLVTTKITDVRSRFKEGKKDYSLWALRSVGNYCISCHAAFHAAHSFTNVSRQLESLSELQRGEFYLATRQYMLARTAFLKVLYTSDNPQDRLEALRSWLMIHCNNFQDAHGALQELREMEARIKFSQLEKQEIANIRSGLITWRDDPKFGEVSLTLAEHLIQTAIATQDPLAGKDNSVSLLRANKILTALLQQRDKPEILEQRGRILYLTGLVYSKLPLYFSSDLPQVFLELCIRNYPGTPAAQASFQLLSEELYDSATGSGGTNLPPETQKLLKELEALASHA